MMDSDHATEKLPIKALCVRDLSAVQASNEIDFFDYIETNDTSYLSMMNFAKSLKLCTTLLVFQVDMHTL
jgi:hypothetical protein